MAKKHRGAFSKEHNSPMTIKQFSDLPVAWGAPMGTPQHSANHPIDNLSGRGQVPLGQSGEQLLSPSEGGLSEGSLGNSRGGGTTQGKNL
jgi:hypothetical protein